MDEDDVRRGDPATDNTTDHPTPDDALEPADDVYNPTRGEETLPEDGDSPAAPAEDQPGGEQLAADHPEFDYDHDAHENYDEGKKGATDVDAEEETEQDLNPPQPLEPQS